MWDFANKYIYADAVGHPQPLHHSGQVTKLNFLREAMETLEFIIYPDGRVQEKVTGIVGSSCAEVTAAIEAQLGQVLHQESTSEYFATTVRQSATATTQATFSDW